ncbi:hypothetical protein BROUX41_003289 [Berkeleyomyces rouxiae]|uniref:uncharacterized protein n=1 Tax=Berkeleyomyces rouxiae TaxID=2035830 RepID=UPI003B7A3180
MCNHIRRDLACGHCKFLIHMYCTKAKKTGRRCRRFVIHREYWGNTICKDCQPQPQPRYDAAGFKIPPPIKKRPSAARSRLAEPAAPSAVGLTNSRTVGSGSAPMVGGGSTKTLTTTMTTAATGGMILQQPLPQIGV